ncbi:MAG: tetratricopeptide repeat protein [Planctomycetes bacterium]|nr:tetratricopeptide repeat protein [Planctomycetota bacterium]
MRPISLVVGLALVAGCASQEPVAEAPAPSAEAEAPVAARPAAPAIDAAAEAEDHCRRGMACLNDGRPEEALEAFSRAVELTPDDPFPWAARSLAHNHLGQRQAAVDDLTAAVERTREEALVLDLLALRGAVRTELGEWAGGVDDLTRCIDGGKDELELRISRGLCLLELGELPRAMTDAEAVVRHAPPDDGARGRGLWLRGLIRERAGQLEPALADLQAAIDAGHTDCQADVDRVREAIGRQ